MLMIISPAKKLDVESEVLRKYHTQARLLPQSQELIDVCQKLTLSDLASLMKISDKLAALNVARFAQWKAQMNTQNAKSAIDMFKGDVYAGLDVDTLSEDNVDWLQKYLRILSGLYGVLRPLDLMMAYRLEMGTKLENPKGTNLYQYWGDTITQLLLKDMRDEKENQVINLASNEYFKAVNTSLLQVNGVQITTPIFKDQKKGQYKIISFYAKKARGMMVRYITQNKLTDVQALKAFDMAGYYYVDDESSAGKMVFHRDEF